MERLGFDLKDLSYGQLLRYAEFLLRHYRLVDAYWFLEVEDNHGLETATEFNRRIWSRLSEVSAKDIMKYMDIGKGDLKTFVKALEYFPWTIIANWKITEFSDTKVVLVADRCPPQEARIKSGRNLYACKALEQEVFEKFAKIFNDKIKVRCYHAPPDPKPEECWCMWEFTVD